MHMLLRDATELLTACLLEEPSVSWVQDYANHHVVSRREIDRLEDGVKKSQELMLF